MENVAITTIHSITAELNKGATVLHLAQPLATYDDSAHVFAVAIERGGESVDITGATCMGYFVRADGVTVPIDGIITGGMASVTLAANCYTVAGRFELAIKLSMGGVVHTVMRVDGSITVSQTDAMTSPGTGVQSFDKLVEAAEKVEQFDGRMTDAETVNATQTEEIDALKSRVTASENVNVTQTELVNMAIERSRRVGNELDNSDWRSHRIINQRGRTAYSGSSGATTHVMERWKTWSTYSSYTFTDDGLQITNSYTGSLGPWQELPNPERLLGKTFTMALSYDGGNIICGTVTIPTATNDSTYYLSAVSANSTHPGIRAQVAGDLSGVSCQVMIGAGMTHTIEWVDMYEGSYTADTLPSHVYRGYAAELAECQRYFRKVVNAQGYVSANNAYLFLPYTMRTTPTVKVDSIGSVRTQGQAITPTGTATVTQYADTIRIALAGTFPEANHAATLFGADIELSADL